MSKDMVTEQVDLRRGVQEPGVRAEEVARRQSHLLGLGFPQEWISSLMIERPTLYDSIVIDDHILGLRERGFSDPNKMIQSLPAILGYAFENIDDKIAGLKKRGFSDPNKMIQSLPAILGYAFENIDRRIRLIGSIISLYHVPFTTVHLMENQNALFSSKIDKIVVLARVLRKTAQDPEEVSNSVINRLLFSNLEDVLIVIDMLRDGEGISTSELLNRVKEIKAAGYTKEEKRNQIEQGLKNDPKIRSRYLKGYPIKE